VQFSRYVQSMIVHHWLFPLVVLSLLGWLYLLFGRSAFWRVRPTLDQEPPALQGWPDVIAVIPARNEAAYVGRALRSLIVQDYPGRLSIVLVDDHSEDATRAIAEALPTTSGRTLEVIAARPLPAGWSGKLWAVSEGLKYAGRHMPHAPYVLLADADIAHDPSNLRRLVVRAQGGRLDLVSVMVKLHCEHFWERLLIPPFIFFFRKLYPFAAVNRPQERPAAAAGGCMLVRRGVLDRAGGIESIRDRLIDDIALAQRIKHHPQPNVGRIWLGLTDGTRSLRRQNRLGELWAMVARTADTQLGHSAALLVLTVLGMLGLYLVPPLAVIGWPLHGEADSAALGLGAWLCMARAYWPTLRLYRLGAHWSLTLPLAGALYTAMTLDSALQYRRGRGGRWKGRVAAPVAQAAQAREVAEPRGQVVNPGFVSRQKIS
jgi:hopene-associated glycosyltransferase HpnB